MPGLRFRASRIWDPLLHPRGRDGQFIEKFGWVEWYSSGRRRTGKVTAIDPDGAVIIRRDNDGLTERITDPQTALASIDPPDRKQESKQKVQGWGLANIQRARPKSLSQQKSFGESLQLTERAREILDSGTLAARYPHRWSHMSDLEQMDLAKIEALIERSPSSETLRTEREILLAGVKIDDYTGDGALWRMLERKFPKLKHRVRTASAAAPDTDTDTSTDPDLPMGLLLAAAFGLVPDSEDEALAAGGHDLVFYERRSTPQVVSQGAKAKPKKGYGKQTHRRKATADEEKKIASGDWLRVDQSGNKPSSPDYKVTAYRKNLGESRRAAQKRKKP